MTIQRQTRSSKCTSPLLTLVVSLLKEFSMSHANFSIKIFPWKSLFSELPNFDKNIGFPKCFHILMKAGYSKICDKSQQKHVFICNYFLLPFFFLMLLNAMQSMVIDFSKLFSLFYLFFRGSVEGEKILMKVEMSGFSIIVFNNLRGHL